MVFKKLLFISILLGSTISPAYSQDLDLVDVEDLDLLLEEENLQDPSSASQKDDVISQEDLDDLDSLRNDIGDLSPEEKANEIQKVLSEDDVIYTDENEKSRKLVNDDSKQTKKTSKATIFDVGKEEAELINVAKYIENKIPSKEWNEIALAAKQDKYVVQEGEWLWKISQSLFGSGFYYAKIWSLNPYITNPHEIKPGMTLVFNTGDDSELPAVALGSFEDEQIKESSNETKVKAVVRKDMNNILKDFDQWGEDAMPPWLKEKKKLLEQGVYIQYGSAETYEDLSDAAKSSLIKEYQNYEPPEDRIILESAEQQYDESGFDKSSKVQFNYKEGFYLNTFLSQNIVQDYGYIRAARDRISFSLKDVIYVKFDSDLKIEDGDLFSTYSAGGKYTHKSSDRSGYKYTVTGQIKTIRKMGELWECEIVETSGIIQRDDRVTVYTPKIDKIIKTFNDRSVEAAIVGSHDKGRKYFSFGDVVYLDRGRADGVELGNVFEVYSFKDRITEKNITPNPTYKIGEVTVITLTDNFSTALVSNSSLDLNKGTIAITKTKEEAAKASKLKSHSALADLKKIEANALEELDVELNLDNLNESLLKKADSVRLTEDELEELERQEREKSVLKDHERDLKALERLESEIEEAEQILNEARADEDKLLEQQNLNDVENKKKASLDEMNDLENLEAKVGKKYLDENLNNRENPFGLTEGDIEEVDELLNSDDPAMQP